MDISLPTGRPGKLLAVGITLAVPLLVWFALVTPMIDLFAARAETLAQRQALDRRMRDLADTLPALQAQVSAGPPSSGLADSPTTPVLDGGTDAVAGATLQQLLQDMALKVGAVLSSTETLPATPVKGYRRIGVRVSLNAPWPVLVGLLQAVEQASPSMLVDDLQVRGLPMLTQPAEPPLDAGFTVLAFRAETPSPSSGPR